MQADQQNKQNWMQWANILGDEEARKLQEKLYKLQMDQFKYGQKKDTASGWGKALGTIGGFLLGGPAGAAAGGTLGGLFR
jgi:hypothetical protein